MEKYLDKKILNAVGSRIKQVRDALKLTQKEYAIKLQTSQSFLSHIEKGHRKPSFEILLSLLTRLDVNLSWLFTGKGEMFENSDEAPSTREELIDKFLDAYAPDLPLDERLTYKVIIQEADDPVMRLNLKAQTLLIKHGSFKEYFDKKG